MTTLKIEFETSQTIREPGYNNYRTKQSGFADVSLTCSRCHHAARIEIKPSMGDDYPAVLRQMKSSCCNVLYLVNYAGTGATLAQVEKIFASSGILILRHDAIEQLVIVYRGD